MAELITHLTVFVSGPSDTSQERELVERTVKALNQAELSDSGIQLRTLMWEHDVTPDFGDYPQDVVNRQVGQKWDFFVGILRSRFGTPTKVAESGTEEEFTRALSRWQEDSRTCKIMMYFSQEPISPSVDVEQLSKVQHFKRRISDEGGFFCEYEDTVDFSFKIRDHLSRFCKEFGKSWGELIDVKQVYSTESAHFTQNTQSLDTQEQETISDVELIDEVSGDDEETVFELTIKVFEAQEEFVNSMERITSHIKQLGKNASAHTKELTPLNTNDESLPYQAKVARLKKAHKILTLTADEMIVESKQIGRELPVMKAAWGAYTEPISKIIASYDPASEADTKNLYEFRDKLPEVVTAVNTSYESMLGLLDAVSGIPELTQQLRRARRQLIIVIQNLLSEMDDMKLELHNLQEAIRRKLNDDENLPLEPAR